jgi:hypothetical protein
MKYDPDLSFYAHVKSETSGFEGYWDRHNVMTEVDANGERKGYRSMSDSLTINNFCNLPERAQDRCNFLFRCYELNGGAPVYQIIVPDYPGGAAELMVHRQLGYLTWSPLDERCKYLWKLNIEEIVQGEDREGVFRGVTMDMINDKGEQWAFLGIRVKGGKLTPYRRKDNWQYWYCSVHSDGGADDPLLTCDIYIHQLGLDD